MRVGHALDIDFDEATVGWLRDRRGEVRTRLTDALHSGFPRLDARAAALLRQPDATLRMSLVFLAGRLGAESRVDAMVTAAVVCELNHLGSLCHARIHEDEGGAANSDRILVGDHLFSTAALLVRELGIDAVRMQAQTTRDLFTGQLCAVLPAEPGTDPAERARAADALRVGALSAACAGLGALAGHAGPDVARAALEVGRQAGVATHAVRAVPADVESRLAVGWQAWQELPESWGKTGLKQLLLDLARAHRVSPTAALSTR